MGGTRYMSSWAPGAHLFCAKTCVVLVPPGQYAIFPASSQARNNARKVSNCALQSCLRGREPGTLLRSTAVIGKWP